MADRLRAFHLVLAVVLIGGLFLRLHHLGVEDLWHDELYALVDAAGRTQELWELPRNDIIDHVPPLTELSPRADWPAVWRTMRYESHPPLYFLLLNSWQRLAGDDQFSVRLFSALCSFLSILLFYVLLRIRGPADSALWGAALLAVAIVDIRMAQEARQYSLALFLVMAGVVCMSKLEADCHNMSVRRRILIAGLYGVLLFSAMLTHYFALLPLLAQGAYAALRFRGVLLKIWGVAVAMAAAIFCVVWLPSLLAQSEYIQSLTWLSSDSANHVQDTLVRTADLPVRILIDWQVQPLSLLRAGLGLLLMLGCLGLLWRRRVSGISLYVLWFVSVVGALVIIDLSSGREMLAHPRFLYFALPSIVALVTLGIGRLSGTSRPVVQGALLVVCLLTLDYPTQHNFQGRALVNELQRTTLAADLIVFDGIMAETWLTHSALLSVCHYGRELDSAVVVLTEAPQPDLTRRMRAYLRIAVINVGPLPHLDPGILPDGYAAVGTPKVGRAIGQLSYFLHMFQRSAEHE